MPAASKKSKAPNQNDLFDIFKAQVEAVAAVNEVVIKAKIDKKTATNIQQAAVAIMDSMSSIFAAVTRTAEFDAKAAESSMNAVAATAKAINAILGSIDQIIAIKGAKISSARRGVNKLAKFLFGKDKKGILGKQMGLFTLMKTAGDKKYSKAINGGSKNLKAISESIKLFNGTLVVIGISLVPLTLALASLWVMSKALKVIIGMFRNLSKYEKSVNKGAKVLNVIAKAVLFIGLAALTLALAGVLIAASWQAMLITMAFVVLLIGIFLIIGWATKWINKGGKELLYIALTVNILAMTAVIMALAGQFIQANWKAMLITMAFVGLLIGVFLLVGWASKWIDKGGKELLYIALTVGILALTALLIVFVGQFIDANWDAVLAVGLMMLGLIGIVLAIGWAGSKIEKAEKAMTKLIIMVVVLALVMAVLAIIAAYGDVLAILELVGIMLLIVVGLGGLAFAAAKLKGIDEGIVKLGEIVVVAGILTIIIGILAVIALIADPLVLLELVGVMCAIVVGIGGLAFAASKLKGIDEGIVTLGKILIIAGVLSVIMGILAVVAALADPLELLELVGVMTLIVVAIGGLALVAGKLKTQILKGIPAMAAITLIATGLSEMMVILAAAAAIADPLELLELAGVMALIVVAIGGIAAVAGAFMLPPAVIWFMMGVAAVGILTALGLALAELIRTLAVAKQEVNKAGITDAYEIAKMVAIPLDAFTMERFGEDGDESLIDIMEDLPDTDDAYWKVRSLEKIIFCVSNIAVTLQKIAAMNMPVKWDKDGKPIEYVQMKSKDFADAAMNASNILAMTAGIFGEKSKFYTFLSDGKEERAWINVVDMAALEKCTWWTQLKVYRLSRIIGHVGSIATTLANIASLKVPDFDKGFDKETGRPNEYRQMKTSDFTEAATNAGSILKLCASIFADEPEQVTIMGKTFTINSQAKVLDDLDNISWRSQYKVAQLGEIVGYVGNMADVLAKMAGLYFPDVTSGWNKETGMWNNYIPMGKEDFERASLNVAKIITVIAGCLADDTLQNNLKKIGGEYFWEKDNSETLAKLLEPMDKLGSIIDIIERLGSGQYVKTWKTDKKGNKIPDTYGSYDELLANRGVIEDRITRVITTITGIFAGFRNVKLYYNGSFYTEKFSYDMDDAAKGAEKVQKAIKPGNEVLESVLKLYTDHLDKLDEKKYIDKWGTQCGLLHYLTGVYAGQLQNGDYADTRVMSQVARNIDKTTDLIKQVGSVDVEKLKNAADLMKHISDLSTSISGNFEGLAKVISEDLLEALEKLTGALDNVNNKEFNVSSPASVISQPSGSAGVKDKMETPASPNKNTLTKQDIDNVTKAVKELTAKVNSVISNRSVQVQMQS